MSRCDAGRLQHAVGPWVVCEAALDLIGIAGAEDQEHLTQAYERANKGDEPSAYSASMESA
jgi:hypothetical protein